MPKELPYFVERVGVTEKNLPRLRNTIVWLRESSNPGLQIAALGIADFVRQGAEQLGAHRDVVDLWWEQSLIGKHIVMGSRKWQQHGGRVAQLGAAMEKIGMNVLERGAIGGQQYLEHHSDFEGRDRLLARSGRFLGDLAMLRGDYVLAERYFSVSIAEYLKLPYPGEMKHVLELSGFLAEANIRNGLVQEGIQRGIRTYSEYGRKEWNTFREREKYTWSVWRSGCVEKVLRAVFAGRHEGRIDLSDRDRLVEMFLMSEADLQAMMQTLPKKKRPAIRWQEYCDLRALLVAKGWLS